MNTHSQTESDRGRRTEKQNNRAAMGQTVTTWRRKVSEDVWLYDFKTKDLACMS